jgi:hypothetical protein
MDKYAAITSQTQRADRIILDSIARYTDLRRAMLDLIKNPTESAAESLDAEFNGLALGLEELGNSISVLAKILISEDGYVDQVDGIEDEHGIRLQ